MPMRSMTRLYSGQTLVAMVFPTLRSTTPWMFGTRMRSSTTSVAAKVDLREPRPPSPRYSLYSPDQMAVWAA